MRGGIGTFHPVIGADRLRLNVLPLLLLLEGEEGRIATGPVGRDEAGAGVVVSPHRRLASDDFPAVAARQRVGGTVLSSQAQSEEAASDQLTRIRDLSHRKAAGSVACGFLVLGGTDSNL